MNAKLIGTSARTAMTIGAITVLFVFALSVLPTAANAQYSEDGGCCEDYGYSNYGADDYGYSNYGQDDYGYSNYGQDDYGYSNYGADDYGYSNYGQDDYGYSNYGQDDYGYSNYGSDEYYGGSYGGGSFGGYSSGGGYSFKPVSGYPTTIYKPTYSKPTPVKPTPTTPVVPSNTSIVNNNTNTNNNTNVNNNTAIAVAQVQIAGQQAPAPAPTYPSPYCTISHTQYTAQNYGTKQIYLTWNSSNASSAQLSGYGSVAVSGSQTVYSAANQTYTLTVYGYNGQQASCQTTVYGTTYTPTPYVSLTQIPYTGFDFGPFGNSMYWAGLISVALAGAYLAVYYVPSMAFAGTTRRAYAPVVASKAPILVEKEAALEKTNPIVAAIRKAGTNDAMAIVKSMDGSMPKIVIERY